MESSAGRRSGPLPPARFNLARYCLASSPPRASQRTALIIDRGAEEGAAPAERYSFGELDRRVRQVAAALSELELAPQARVLIRLGNTVEYPLAFFGTIAAGRIALPSSQQLTAGELEVLAADAGAELLVVDEADPVALPAGPRVISALELTERAARLEPSAYADTAADAPAFLIYTSGTSARPKGVLHAQRSAWGRRPMIDGWYGGLGPTDVVLHAGSVNWTYTLGVGLTDPWACGAVAVLYRGQRDPTVWPRLVARHRATLFAAVPGLYRQILARGEPQAADLSSLRHGLCAGEPLRPKLAAAWRAATGVELYEALGMSECSTYISSSPSVPTRPGSPGKPQPGRLVAILPTEGGTEPLAVGEVGLLAVHRSDPGLMLGYWDRPEEERRVYRGPWFIGGDLASIDEDGYVHYHGRNDEVLTTFGYRISPLEIERCLAAHPEIAEVAVGELDVGEPASSVELKVVAAFVVPIAGASLDRDAVLAYAAQRLARYKCPREVVFVGGLPRSANGKLLRRALPRRKASK